MDANDLARHNKRHPRKRAARKPVRQRLMDMDPTMPTGDFVVVDRFAARTTATSAPCTAFGFDMYGSGCWYVYHCERAPDMSVPYRAIAEIALAQYKLKARELAADIHERSTVRP